MSQITIYNDGEKDAQIVVLNHLTNKPAVHHPLPISKEDASTVVEIDLHNGDLIIVTLADSPVRQLRGFP